MGFYNYPFAQIKICNEVEYNEKTYIGFDYENLYQYWELIDCIDMLHPVCSVQIFSNILPFEEYYTATQDFDENGDVIFKYFLTPIVYIATNLVFPDIKNEYPDYIEIIYQDAQQSSEKITDADSIASFIDQLYYSDLYAQDTLVKKYQILLVRFSFCIRCIR